MYQLGNLALVCAKKENVDLRVCDGQVTVHIGFGEGHPVLSGLACRLGQSLDERHWRSATLRMTTAKYQKSSIGSILVRTEGGGLGD